jgi:hypothetical protein
MTPLVVVVLVGGALIWTVRSARRRRGDRHSLAAHHRALVALGEIARPRVSHRPGRTPLLSGPTCGSGARRRVSAGGLANRPIGPWRRPRSSPRRRIRPK